MYFIISKGKAFDMGTVSKDIITRVLVRKVEGTLNEREAKKIKRVLNEFTSGHGPRIQGKGYVEVYIKNKKVSKIVVDDICSFVMLEHSKRLEKLAPKVDWIYTGAGWRFEFEWPPRRKKR